MYKLKPFLLLAVLGILLALPLPATAAISLVQKTEAAPQETISGVTSRSASYPAPPATGNLLVAIVSGDVTGTLTPPAGWSTAVNEPFTVDVVGAQYFQIPSQAIFYRVAAAAEPQNVSFQYPSDPDANVAIQLYEYSGVASVSPLSSVASNFGHLDTDGAAPGFQINSGTLLPTTAPALLIAGFAGRPVDASPVVNGGTGNGSLAAYTNSFVEQSNMSTGEVPCDTADTGCYGIAGLDRITSALGSASVSATFGPAEGGWRGQIAAFKSAAPTAAPATISGRVTTTSGAPLAGVTMYLSGGSAGRTITDSNGNYRFPAVDADNLYTVTPAIMHYQFSPSSRSFSLLANNTDAVFTGMPEPGRSGNVIDSPEYFVRQHYLDFLGREPDYAGLNFWSDQMRGCGNDFDCVERRTINVSAAYFLSIEFQETGGLVDGLYRASYDRAPQFAEFMPDTATVAHNVIVGETGWNETLRANKEAFLDAWVQRASFRAAYDNLTNDSYVDTLISHTNVNFTDSERAALVSGLTGNTLTRAQVLQHVVENERFVKAKFNEAFVRMQYFGYLRRDPDDSGFQFWLNKLDQFEGNFEQAEMVKAFILSGEYRDRFRQ
jgi:hypothetical protein